MFAEDAAIMATSEVAKYASDKLQETLNNIQKLLKN